MWNEHHHQENHHAQIYQGIPGKEDRTNGFHHSLLHIYINKEISTLQANSSYPKGIGFKRTSRLLHAMNKNPLEKNIAQFSLCSRQMALQLALLAIDF